MNNNRIWNNILRVDKGPWPYCRLWLILTVIAETLMLIFNHHLVVFYRIIALLFSGGFLLRLFKVYPGQPEPLILDLSAVLIAAVYAYVAEWLGVSPWRFLLIVTSSAIILPHIFYVFNARKILDQ